VSSQFGFAVIDFVQFEEFFEDLPPSNRMNSSSSMNTSLTTVPAAHHHNLAAGLQ
jgi:hypothetical protein